MAAPQEVETLNFAACGIRWTVRQPSGEKRRFFTLMALRDAIDEGFVVLSEDELSFDEQSWRRLSDIPDLGAYFWGVFTRYRSGKLSPSTPIIDQDLDEIGDDEPTQLAMPSTMVSAAIQEALARELSANLEQKALPPTPAPTPTPAPPSPPAGSSLAEYALLGAGGVVLLAGLALWLGG